MYTRRDFLKQTLAGSAFMGAFGIPSPFPADRYRKRKSRHEKIRIIIETDAGGDPDDEQSMVRFLLYANVFDIEGIIANRRDARPGENKNPVRDGLGIVRAFINAYSDCYPNLIRHDRGFPEPEYLFQRVVPGYDDTDEGVNLIIRAVDSSDPRPVWFCNWGTDKGSPESCLKRALDNILLLRGPGGYAKFKNRIYLSSSDKFGDHTTTINPPFPFWVDTWRPPIDGKRWYHRFSPLTFKAGGFNIERDVRTGHGPLGLLYPLNTNYLQKEGDTMSFLYLIPTGMNDPYEPGWGSWAGRYGLNEEHHGKNYYWANRADSWNGSTSRDNMLARWAEAFQNDFRARMDWCIKTYKEANHHPVALIKGFPRKGIIRTTVKPGDIVHLNANRSFDPDGRNIIPKWYIYNEAGTYIGQINLEEESGLETTFTAPAVEKPETIHIILELRNDGDPSLYCYRRIIITVTP
jgi:hypothetical protein